MVAGRNRKPPEFKSACGAYVHCPMCEPGTLAIDMPRFNKEPTPEAEFRMPFRFTGGKIFVNGRRSRTSS